MSDLLGDAGPAFNPEDVPDDEARVELAPEAGAGGANWQQARVRALLKTKGELVHNFLAVDKASGEWRYTDADLAAIAPPLTRILNRYDATRAAAAVGDEAELMVGLFGYAARSYSERRIAIARLRAAAAAEEQAGRAPAGRRRRGAGGPRR